jgi:hypothetical protein
MLGQTGTLTAWPTLQALFYDFFFFFSFVVLGLELGPLTLSHSTSPIFVEGFLR